MGKRGWVRFQKNLFKETSEVIFSKFLSLDSPPYLFFIFLNPCPKLPDIGKTSHRRSLEMGSLVSGMGDMVSLLGLQFTGRGTLSPVWGIWFPERRTTFTSWEIELSCKDTFGAPWKDELKDVDIYISKKNWKLNFPVPLRKRYLLFHTAKMTTVWWMAESQQYIQHFSSNF